MGAGGGRTRGAAARSVLLGRRRRRWRRRLRLASCSASSSPRPGCRSDGGSSGPGGAEGAGRPAGGQGRREAGSGPGRGERDRAWARAAAVAVSLCGSSCSCSGSGSRCRCSSSSSRARLHHAAGSHLLERRSLRRRPPPSLPRPRAQPSPARPGPWGHGGRRTRSGRRAAAAGAQYPARDRVPSGRPSLQPKAALCRDGLAVPRGVGHRSSPSDQSPWPPGLGRPSRGSPIRVVWTGSSPSLRPFRNWPDLSGVSVSRVPEQKRSRWGTPSHHPLGPQTSSLSASFELPEDWPPLP